MKMAKIKKSVIGELNIFAPIALIHNRDGKLKEAGYKPLPYATPTLTLPPQGGGKKIRNFIND
jgi:hypothetical protein